MNTSSNHTAFSDCTSLFQDRPLDHTSDVPAPYHLTAPVGGESWEVALRSLLVLCLVASMMAFGFSVSTAPQPAGTASGTVPTAAVKPPDHAARVAFPVAACQETAHRTATTL